MQARELLIAAYYNSRNYEAAYTALKHYPSPDGNLRAALQKIAYFRGLEAYSRGDLDGAAQSLSGVGRDQRQPQVRGAGPGSGWARSPSHAATTPRPNAATRSICTVRLAPRTNTPRRITTWVIAISIGATCRTPMPRSLGSTSSIPRPTVIRPMRSTARPMHVTRCGVLRSAGDLRKGGGRRHEREILRRFPACRDAGHSRPRPQKIEALQRIIAADRGDYVDDATYELGRTYIASERYDDGAKVLSKFVEENPHSPFFTPALSDLGLAYLNLGQPELSRRCYERVVESAPGFGHGARRLAGHPRDLRGRRQCRRLLRLRREGRRGV